jgi:uncharacterized membrane protein YjjB (DUF3815 family)
VAALYITLLLRDAGVGAIPASGVAAAGVGTSGHNSAYAPFISQTIVTITAGIIPLVPGLTLYSGLMYIAQSTPDTATFNLGVDLVVRAILIAIVVATGAAFGKLDWPPGAK